jgi:hypothetical protein
MNCSTVAWNHRTPGSFRRPHLILGFLVLLACCSVALAQDPSQPASSPFSIPATHLLGFEGTSANANGTLSIQDGALRFEKSGKPAVELKIASIQDVFLGGQSKQVGGVPMTLGKAAVPFGGGRVVSLFAHKNYDTLTVEYVDTNGGAHGAIFQLNKGRAQALRSELVARGLHISTSADESTKQSEAEVPSENK